MKTYIEPEIKIQIFQIADVITTSEFDDDNTGEPISPWSTRQWD